MKLLQKFVGAVLVLSGCTSPQASGLLDELRSESSLGGLALASSRGNNMVIIPFGAKEKYVQTPYPHASVTFGADGRILLWQYARSFYAPAEFAIESIVGDRVAGGRPQASSFLPAALNTTSGRIAFRGAFQDRDSRTGLNWASFDFTRGGFIGEADGGCDWAPEGDGLVYEDRGRIFIFELANASSKFLVQGHDPSGSPNGDRIAYRSLDGLAAVVTIQGAAVSWPIGRHRPLSTIRWSPDARYVSFSEEVPGPHIPLVSAYYQLLVLRVSDGESITMRKFGAGAVDAAAFHWILNYGQFCKQCEEGFEYN
jgi:hypothetical protein